MPVLARTLEASGFCTVLVTSMPYWAERVGVPRTLGIEFPFGHTLGEPHNASQQMYVIQEALEVLSSASGPGEIQSSSESWPGSVEEAIEAWQPTEPSPIIGELSPRIREMVRELRKKE